MTAALLDRFDSQRCQSVRRALTRWFEKHGRSLPWRRTSDPYRIWISEIMLQQTTVKAVIPYYERFLKRFPTVGQLAAASEAEVLQMWEGLGYYSRGRNLRLAAQVLCGRNGGAFPTDVDQLQELPGVGRYTASAIRSFAFDLPAPIVEANTSRVYCRLLGYEGDLASRDGQQLLWDFAERLQPSRRAGRVNQALMELGAAICTPMDPRCEVCPISQHCAAFASGSQSTIPRKKSHPQVTQIVEATVAIRSGNKFFVRRRTAGERWAGMWDFVRFPIESVAYDDPLTTRAMTKLIFEVTARLAELVDSAASPPRFVHELRHSVTRYRIRLLGLLAEWEESRVGSPKSRAKHCAAQRISRDRRATQRVPDVSFAISHEANGDGDIRWATLSQLKKLPMPVTGRKFASLLDSN